MIEKKKKRKYTKPTIEEYSLDKAFVLVMASVGDPPKNPDNPFTPAAASSEKADVNVNRLVKDNPFASNPWE